MVLDALVGKNYSRIGALRTPLDDLRGGLISNSVLESKPVVDYDRQVRGKRNISLSILTISEPASLRSNLLFTACI